VEGGFCFIKILNFIHNSTQRLLGLRNYYYSPQLPQPPPPPSHPEEPQDDPQDKNEPHELPPLDPPDLPRPFLDEAITNMMMSNTTAATMIKMSILLSFLLNFFWLYYSI
jgi:hypothetical protein